MTERVLPGIGLNGFWDQGAPWKVGGDQNWLKSSVLTQLAVESATTVLPASPLNGVIYIVPAAGSPANQIAARDNGAWVYFPPFKGLTAYVRDTGSWLVYDGAAWGLSAPSITYAPPGAGSITRSVAQQLAIQPRSFLDKLTDAELADCLLAAPVGDLSAKMQAFFNENKGGTVVFPEGYRYPHFGINLSGPDWDGTTILIYGELFLKKQTGAEPPPPYPAYIGLTIRDCDRVFLWYRGSGNRANQPVDDHAYMVALSGVTNFRCPLFTARDISGDALYITQKEFAADSKRCQNLSFGIFDAANTAPDGRNAITIVSAIGLYIDSFRSVNVGAALSSVMQPGGFCIEPNAAYQDVANITVGSLHVEGQGGTMFQIAGTATNYANNVNIGSCVVINTTLPNTNSPITGTPIANQYRVANILRSRNVQIGSFSGSFVNAYGDGMAVAECDNVQLPAVTLRHVRLGAVLGQSSVTPLRNSRIHVVVSDCIQGAIQTGNIDNSKITGRVLPVTTGYYASKFAVWAMRAGGVQNNVEYGVSVDYSADWTRAYRNDNSNPVTLNGCTQKDCDVSGAWSGVLLTADMLLFRQNVTGLNNLPAMPTQGSWVNGTYVRVVPSPPVGSPKGYIRTTTGSSNVLNTDWVSDGNL